MQVEVLEARFDPPLNIKNDDEFIIRWSFDSENGYKMKRPLLNGLEIGNDPIVTVTYRDVPDPLDFRAYEHLSELLPRELREQVHRFQEFPTVA